MLTNIGWVSYFNSLTEYEAYLNAGTTQSAFKRKMSSQETYGSDDCWAGSKDYATANNWLLYGNKEAAEKIKEAQRKIKFDVNKYIEQSKILPDYVGFAPHVPNFVANQPKTMFAKKKVRKPQPVITVCYNTGATAQYEPEEIADAGAKLLEAIRTIEASGIRVNLYAAQVSKSSGEYAGPIVRIKDADQYLDLLKCAYPLTSPSMLRRHKFRYLEVTKGLPSHFASGYGSSIDDGTILKQVKLQGRKFDAVLTFYDIHNHCETVDDVITEIKNQARENLSE